MSMGAWRFPSNGRMETHYARSRKEFPRKGSTSSVVPAKAGTHFDFTRVQNGASKHNLSRVLTGRRRNGREDRQATNPIPNPPPRPDPTESDSRTTKTR